MIMTTHCTNINTMMMMIPSKHHPKKMIKTNLSSLRLIFISLLVLSPHLHPQKSNEYSSSLFCHGYGYHVVVGRNSKIMNMNMNAFRNSKCGSNSNIIRTTANGVVFSRASSSSFFSGGTRFSVPIASTCPCTHPCSRIKRRDQIITLYNSKNNDNNQEVKENDSKKNTNNDNNSEKEKENSNINEEEEEDDDDNLVTYEELMRDPELFRMEYMKSRERKNNLFLLDNIGKAFYVLVLTFVISSIVLKGFGYGFVIDSSSDATSSGGFRVGASNIQIVTLENKAFILEMQGKDSQAAKIRKSLKGYNDNLEKID